MAWLRPLRGLRFCDDGENLGLCVAPPSQTLSDKQRDEFGALSPFNIVHVSCPEVKEDDRSRFIRYARSASTLAQWRRDHTIEVDSDSRYYVVRRPSVTNSFREPATEWLIGLLEVDSQTEAPAANRTNWEHRLRLLEATQAQVEPALATVHNLSAPIAAFLGTATHLAEANEYEITAVPSSPEWDRIEVELDLQSGDHLRAALEFSQGNSPSLLLVAAQILQVKSPTRAPKRDNPVEVITSPQETLPELPSGLILWSLTSF